MSFYSTKLKIIHILKLRSCNRIKHGFFSTVLSFNGGTASEHNKETSLIKSFQRL